MRAPASVRAVSDRIGIPYETTRQHLLRLAEAGRAKRVAGGFIIPGTVNKSPRYLRMGLNIYLWLLRAVTQLDRLGFDVAAAVAWRPRKSAPLGSSLERARGGRLRPRRSVETASSAPEFAERRSPN